MAPHSFILEDANGFNAVEYAIANNADMTAIKTMQQTARDDWRVMKAMGRGKTHDEMKRVVRQAFREQGAHTRWRVMKAMGRWMTHDEMDRVVRRARRTSRSARSSPRASPVRPVEMAVEIFACRDLRSRDLTTLASQRTPPKIRPHYHRSSSHPTLVKSMGSAPMIKARVSLLAKSA